MPAPLKGCGNRRINILIANGRGVYLVCFVWHQVRRLMEGMEQTRQEKESLAQRCHELELRLNLLQASHSAETVSRIRNYLFRIRIQAMRQR